MTKRTLLIAIPVVAVLLNGVGYLVFIKARTSDPAVKQRGAERPLPLEAPAPSLVEPTAPGRPEPAPVDGRADKEGRAEARRAAGLAALEAGKYEKALIHFTEAKALIGDKANVEDLLRVTEDLRRHAPANGPRTRAELVPSGGRKLSSASASRTGGRRAVVRDDAPGEPTPPPAVSVQDEGLLIVTTTPRGFLVHVDDAPIDLTPMKARVRPGTHRVSLVDGDRKVYETTVDVKEGGTATLLRDLSAERIPEEPRVPSATAALPGTSPPSRAELRPAVAIAAPASSVFSGASAAPSGTAKNKTLDTPASAPSNAGQLGTLEIASPGLYGVVWVNGRPRGYPPLAVRDLPAGPVKVEVRVNGVPKRVTMATVKPGLTTSVKLRAQEAALP